MNMLQGDATEDEERRLMARKEGLLSSKLLRGLFGGIVKWLIRFKVVYA